jgi:hypothetical protein
LPPVKNGDDLFRIFLQGFRQRLGIQNEPALVEAVIAAGLDADGSGRFPVPPAGEKNAFFREATRRSRSES